MDRLLFLVARDQPDLWDQLNKEFSGRDVAVVVDRRRGERRRNEAESADNRRQSERRERAEVDREVRSRGFSVIRLDGARQREGNPRAVRTVQAYVQERFRHFTTVTSWDARREAQTFIIFNGAGRAAHRVLFDREFLDYYGATMADRIPSVLDEWRLTSYLESVGSQLVVVSSFGLRTADR
jgi:hypothetical protein